jgi:hypothetical protein
VVTGGPTRIGGQNGGLYNTAGCQVKAIRDDGFPLAKRVAEVVVSGEDPESIMHENASVCVRP